MKKFAILVLLLVGLMAVSASAQNGPVGGSLGYVGSAKCEDPTLNELVWCFTQAGKIQWSWNKSPYADFSPGGGNSLVTSVFGRTGAVVAQTGDYTFQQIAGQVSVGQLPSTQICTFVLTGTQQDGKGTTSGTATITACH